MGGRVGGGGELCVYVFIFESTAHGYEANPEPALAQK